MAEGLAKKFTEKIRDILKGRIVLKDNFRQGNLSVSFERQLRALPWGYCQVEINGEGHGFYMNRPNQSFEYDFVGEVIKGAGYFEAGAIKLKCTPYTRKERIEISEAEAKAAEARWLLSRCEAA